MIRLRVKIYAVSEFDAEGNFVQGWGGPGPGYDWLKNEHGLYVDAEGYVWVAGYDPVDHMNLGDAQKSQIPILSRSDGKPLASFGRHGRYAGEFRTLHNLAIDSKGNIYTGEAGFGRRVQKFVRTD